MPYIARLQATELKLCKPYKPRLCWDAGQAADPLRGVNVVVERAERNSRRLYAAVQIAAPVETVWGALTDYEGLGNFIPGLHLRHYIFCFVTSHACSCRQCNCSCSTANATHSFSAFCWMLSEQVFIESDTDNTAQLVKKRHFALHSSAQQR